MNNQPSFVGKDELSKKIANFAIDKNKRRNFQINNEVFQPEYVTQCERRIIYRCLGYQLDLEPISHDIGYIKDKWLSIFMHMDDAEVLGVDYVVVDINNNISGKIDIIVDFENMDLKTICTIRGVNDDVYKKITENGPIRKDTITDMMYMWLSEIPNCIMIYENLDNESFEVFHIIPYNPLIKSAKDKYQRLLMYKMKGQIPNRPKEYSSKECAECKLCEFKNTCWLIK